MGFPTWEPASHCTGGPAPGASALMRWFVENYHNKGGFNLGIYNCRSVRGASTTSMHGEGRACDFGFPVGDKDGDALLKLLLKNVGKLGIQAIIYERRIYSAKSPGGRPYTGLVPHTDHLHVELTREAGRHLTYATVKKGLTQHVWKPGTRNLSIGASGADVRYVQTKVGMNDADGEFGPRTKTAVLRWERRQKAGHPNLVVDGVVGKLTWKLLGVEPKY